MNDKKKLVILTDHAEAGILKGELLKGSELYAMTPGAMLACEEHGLPYITNEDFYPYMQFRRENESLQHEAEELFLSLDKQYEHYSRFPRAYTANIYWFLILFSDMFYVSKVCEKIARAYGDIIIVGKKEWDGPIKLDLSFSPNGFIPRFAGLENKVRMFSQCFAKRAEWIDGAKLRQSDKIINWRSTAYKFRQLKKGLISRVTGGAYVRDNDKRAIFVIQDGYEITGLKKYLSGYSFIDISRELAMAGESVISSIEETPAEWPGLGEFINKYFPIFERDVISFFGTYRDRVVSRIGHFERSIRKLIGRHKPAAFFYSKGSNGVYEDLYASIASEEGIPVFYFQHGGSVQVFHKDPNQKYHEHNRYIKKVQIYHSKVEQEICAAENGNGDGLAAGSVRFFDMYKNAKRRCKSTRTILYCPTVFNFGAWKQLLYSAPDVEMHAVHKDILEVSAGLSLRLDVKAHPGQEEYQGEYFGKLIKRYGKLVRVIRGIPAEEIVKDYGGVIFDNISTVLLPVAFLYPIPIILYFKDGSVLNPKTKSDLESRCYIVDTVEGLKECMLRYKEGALPSKYSIEMIDKYVFPVTGDEPAARISSYVAKLTAEPVLC